MDPYDEGWADGVRDVNDLFSPEPSLDYDDEEIEEYMEGYLAARQNYESDW